MSENPIVDTSSLEALTEEYVKHTSWHSVAVGDLAAAKKLEHASRSNMQLAKAALDRAKSTLLTALPDPNISPLTIDVPVEDARVNPPVTAAT